MSARRSFAGVKICSGEATASFVLEPSEVVDLKGLGYHFGLKKWETNKIPVFYKAIPAPISWISLCVSCVVHDQFFLLLVISAAHARIAGYVTRFWTPMIFGCVSY